MNVFITPVENPSYKKESDKIPLYDYLCEHCNEAFEIRLTFQEKDEGIKPDCPKCGGNRTQQRLTAGMFIQKNNNGGSISPSFGCGPSAGIGCCG